ncbi:MAG: zeta toxin family protein [Bacteroidaceae bacterium]|nr:zeta toxin family protein [Bacteroidaceae bacterium]
MPRLYIIAGCNGAGKTTASFTVLPEMLNCTEFVNADEIARGLSPFKPESVALEAGRIMLDRILLHIRNGVDFALETTLATRSYAGLIKKAQAKGYFVSLLYFWLVSPEQAIMRVAKRVAEGGHNIPEDVIRRRYTNGLRNLFELYIPICDYWVMYDNSCIDTNVKTIASGSKGVEQEVPDMELYNTLKKKALEL